MVHMDWYSSLYDLLKLFTCTKLSNSTSRLLAITKGITYQPPDVKQTSINR